MSSISMASISSSFSSLSALYNDRPDLESIRLLVISINQYVLDFMTNVERWHTLKMRCISNLSMQKQEFFEFSEHSVLSNLYWAIDGIEAAIQAKWPEEKTSRLKNSEGMLQVPALLDEHEVTAGIPNRYLVCCSYFYLSVVKNLQEDELQVALHFLQALSVFPGLIGIEFAPEICESLFPSCILPKQHEMGAWRSLEFVEFDKENNSEAMRQLARRYKHCLMYYQVLIVKEAPQWRSGDRDISSSDNARHFTHEISTGNESSKSIEHGHTLRSYNSNKHAKVYPLGPQEDTTDGITDEAEASREVPEIQDYCKALKCLDQVPRLPLHRAGVRRNSSVKCLHDMLKESQSDMSSSFELCSADFEEESDFEAKKEVIEFSAGNERGRTENPQPETFDQKLQDHCSSSGTDFTAITLRQAPRSPQHKRSNEVNKTKDISEKFVSSIGDFKLSTLELVTAFDYATSNMHLAAISSPRVLCGLIHMATYHNLEELISLATILVKCMQFDGQCRKYISQFTPVAPLISLLQSSEQRAMFIALEFFHEILCIPRSSAIHLLQRILKEGTTNILNTLKLCLQQLQPHYQVLAANLLLQLDTLENSSGKSVLREETIQVLLRAVASEESSSVQLLSSFILSNIGGTFAWTGEPYTVAWLVKKAGLTSLCLQNMIRNFDWLDQSLQDAEVDSWCSKIAKGIIEIGKPVFRALREGLKSKIRRVSRDSLTTIAWLGCEIAKSPNRLRYSACEILLDGVEQFLHPGIELEERLLACLCIYNYASGTGMKKVIHFSEGVRESLRRFSNVTWMAEELHRVAEFYLPNNSQISCVHTQILEASHIGNGAVTALIYYKGMLYSGHSDGSIKVWDIKMQSSMLVWDIKEHSKAVTCFSLFEPGESLLSGSADKTVKVWQMVQRKLELIEVISTNEPIQKLGTYGKMIFAITQGQRMKVIDSSRTLKDICSVKKIKCMSIVQGRIYVGCTDSSIQELSVANNLEREIKAPAKSWRMQTKSINSIVVYKEWLYCASSIVEGSNVKEWRRHCEPQKSIIPGKGTNILAMGVVEDFIYLSCSYSASSLQIWLRGTQQKVGRISAGSKITSLLTANDMVLCGTETGLIKGWIPM